MLKASGIGKKYDAVLFNNLNLTLNPQQTLAILGKSGCGKSTLLHILSTLLAPDSGEVFYKDKNIYKISEDERLKIRRNDFGIIFQQHYLFKGFSAYENIELASVLSNNKIDDEIINFLGIKEILNKKANELSGGEQQRVSIARVLCKKPKIIFADEPTGNLDPTNAKIAMKLLIDYVKLNNSALFLITHDENLALMCDDILRINNE